MSHTFNRFDQVAWERDGGEYSGMVAEVQPRYCRVMTVRGVCTVYIEDLRLVYSADKWDPDTLRNHLRVVYGVSPTPNAKDDHGQPDD